METLRQFRGYAIVSVFVFINIFVWSAVLAQEDSGVLTVAFLDVGQGDAIFIEAPNGNQMLIDGGPNASVLRQLSEIMPFHDRAIDIVLATHPDKDHVAGLIDVFERYDVGRYIDPGVSHDSGTYETLLRSVEAEGAPYVHARRGMRIILDAERGVYADVLFPDRDVTNIETNTGSIIMRLVYGESEFMLTGDAPHSIERHVVALDGAKLKSDVLKAGHHGSRTSSATEFVALVDPDIAVISAGRNNSYGHPHQEVLDTLARFDVEVFSTTEEGTIIFTSDGMTIRRE